MKKKILIAAQKIEASMKLISALSLVQGADIMFISKAQSAIKQVRKNDYDLIILGDRLDEGDTLDIALEIKTGRKNKRIPVVCVGYHTGRAIKVVNLLGTWASHSPGAESIADIVSYFEPKEVPNV